MYLTGQVGHPNTDGADGSETRSNPGMPMEQSAIRTEDGEVAHVPPPDGATRRPVGPFVVLIRHAERLDGPDPGLSPAGRARAELLARMLADASVVGVYVTDTRRSRETGRDTATTAGLSPTQYVADDATGLAASIARGPDQGAVLVVAHSNTVDDIATAPGAESVGELAEEEFDRMLVLGPDGSVLRLRFGAPAH